jgi:hypothetical protein
MIRPALFISTMILIGALGCGGRGNGINSGASSGSNAAASGTPDSGTAMSGSSGTSTAGTQPDGSSEAEPPACLNTAECPPDSGFEASASQDASDACGYCPSSAPTNGDLCPAGCQDYLCTWGDAPVITCRTQAECTTICGGPGCPPHSSKWVVTVPPQACTATDPRCPSTPTGTCTIIDGGYDIFECVYPDGTDCTCEKGGDPPNCLAKVELAAPCPSVVPNAGTPCSLDAGTSCVGRACGGNVITDFSVVCQDGVWNWRGESCSAPVCASPDTPIETPDGERPIADIQVGDLVYSVDHEAIRPVLVTRIGRHRAQNHHVVRVVTADGRTLEISAPHPTADGRSFGDLRPGGLLDGHAIESVEMIPYAHEYTYDILPASDTGTYFAAGMQIGSTLKARDSGILGVQGAQ